MIVPQENFDIDKTIFATLDSEIVKKIQASKIGVTLYWTDQAAMRINASFAKVPQAPRYDQCLVDFMEHECDFAVEHADGSFMDHLRFCFEYSHAHYPQKSPRVLLLHSIMGVGTNFFPMAAEQIPRLKGMLSEEEFDQVAMFPTMLRLYYHGPLRDELDGLTRAQLDRCEERRAWKCVWMCE